MVALYLQGPINQILSIVDADKTEIQPVIDTLESLDKRDP